MGKFESLGPYGTYDLVGNVREWYVERGRRRPRFLLGRLPTRMAPEALSPFDRSALNGLRCVVNDGALPDDALAPLKLLQRDFSKAVPATDEVFAAYRAMYAYDKTPLDAKVEALRRRFGALDAAEDHVQHRLRRRRGWPAYLFLPKRVRPPYQVVVFFPSARVNALPSSSELGDLTFMDFVVDSGRAVIYPIYQYLYERRAAYRPTPARRSSARRLIDWSKDLGRSLDYLATREDIDMRSRRLPRRQPGRRDGVVLAALEDRIKAVVLLDGGFFEHEQPVAGHRPGRLRAPAQEARADGQRPLRLDVPARSSQQPMFDDARTPADESATSCSTRRTMSASASRPHEGSARLVRHVPRQGELTIGARGSRRSA